MRSEEVLFLFHGNSLVVQSQLLQQCYDANRSEDGFLYVFYDTENAFG